MKILKKIAFLALVIFAAAGCENSLSETSPSLGDFNRSKGFEAGSATSPANYFPLITGQLNVTAGAEQYILNIVFPNVELDFLKIPNGNTAATRFNAIQEEMIKFLHFYSLESRNDAYAASQHVGEIPYTVVRRDGNTIDIRLTLPPNVSSSIEAFVDPERYTFRGGQKLDIDGNGVAGEPWFDALYGYYTVTGGTAITLGDRRPRSGIELRFSWTDGLGGSTISNNTVLTDFPNFPDLYLNIGYGGSIYNDDVDRGSVIGAMIHIEKYNRASGSYEPLQTGPIAQSSVTPYTYGIPIPITSIKAFDLIRVRVESDPARRGFITTGFDYYGGSQRYYSSVDRKKRINEVESLTFSSSDYFEIPQFWTGIKVSADEDGFNGYIILDLDLSSGGNIGNQGIQEPGADFSRYFKIGYTRDTSGVATKPDLSWNKLTFIPIKSAARRYSGINPPAVDPAPDQLRVDLDPGLKIESGNRFYVIIGNGLGNGYQSLGDRQPGGTTPVGEFGDFRNVQLVIDGVSGFVNYGYVTAP
jgi:hypothetical protein